MNIISLTLFLFRLNGSLAGSSPSEGSKGVRVSCRLMVVQASALPEPVVRPPVLPPAAMRFPTNSLKRDEERLKRDEQTWKSDAIQNGARGLGAYWLAGALLFS